MARLTQEKPIWIPLETHHELKVMSAQEGRTLKAFVTQLLEEYKNAKARN